MEISTVGAQKQYLALKLRDRDKVGRNAQVEWRVYNRMMFLYRHLRCRNKVIIIDIMCCLDKQQLVDRQVSRMAAILISSILMSAILISAMRV
jgi:hypothetical protein